MSGDLSLGPLRIANPDDSSLASPTEASFDVSSTAPASGNHALSHHRPPPPPSSHSSESTLTAARGPNFLPGLSHVTRPDESRLDFNPDGFHLQGSDYSPPPLQAQSPRSPSVQQQTPGSRARLSHRSSMPLAHQAQQQLQYPTSSFEHNGSPRTVPGQDASRPLSQMYTQMNGSSSSNMSQASNRYREDRVTSDGSTGGLARSNSRSTRQLVGSLPQREPSRTYRQPSTPVNGGSANGQLPLRRHSKRGRATTGGSSSTGAYEGTDQPYPGPMPMPKTADQRQERGAATTGVRKDSDASGTTQARAVKKGVKDFNFGRTLGEGSYSTVLAATDRQNLKEYAIKVLDKRHIIKEKKVKYVNIERDTLNRLTEHPGVVRLYYTFQDERSLYFVLDLASGGELLGVLKKLGSFDVQCTRFYAAEILDSIAYMHSRGIIHRDLKPENVLLDRDMHVKITDFGTAKILPDPRPNSANQAGGPPGHPSDGANTDRAVSFVGTAEYVSPELLRDKNACKASDLWAFGCIVYQLLAGRPPFKAANEYLTFQKILGLDYTFPNGFPEDARDLVERLLVLEPTSRLPIEHIKNHQFFDGVQWGKTLWRQKAPRLKAYIPPPNAPIRLNGTSNRSVSNNVLASSGAAAAMQNAAAMVAAQSQSQSQPQPQPQSQPQAQAQASIPAPPRRPQLQNVTELPPPSQLDIDWSPVLTHNNERILKLGNLVVTTAPQSTSPNSKGGEPQTPSEKPKFSRFFTGNNGKKRERLVLITSSARLVVAAAGGNEKKSKMDINLSASLATCKICVDSKGLTYWSVDTRDKYFTFEDPRATTSDPAGSKFSTQEWLDAVEQAREVALATSMSNSYSSESAMNEINASTVSSPADSLGADAIMPLGGSGGNERHHLRHTLRRNTDDESLKGRKRFSKRHSKSGLAAVF